MSLGWSLCPECQRRMLVVLLPDELPPTVPPLATLSALMVRNREHGLRLDVSSVWRARRPGRPENLEPPRTQLAASTGAYRGRRVLRATCRRDVI